MQRRNFFFSLASFSALLARPAAAAPPEPIATSAAAISEQIKTLEAHVKLHPEPFPWAEHNELRHLYGAISEAKSMWHVDAILAHSLMDEYMLNILSDWQLETDPGIAAVNLMTKAEKHSSLLHLRAACLLKVGDLCRQHDQPNEAKRLYRSIAELAEVNDHAQGLQPYARLAQFRLGENFVDEQ